MRSSTSNSDWHARHWRKAWLLAAAIVLLVVGGWEILVRGAGHAPEFADNRALWLSARHRLTTPDPSVIAVLGASRVQRAVDGNVLADALGRPVVQLAVEGSSGLPVLENLAADPRFRGTVVISIAPPFSFNRRLSKLDAGDQAAWVRDYLQQSRSRRMEQELRLGAQGLFAFRSADASVSRLLPGLLATGELPSNDFKTTTRDRFVAIEPEKYEVTVNEETVVELYDQLLGYFAQVVQILNAKGSRVFVVRLPTDGLVRDYERETFPKEQFWNRMQQAIPARFIHADDYPELAGFMSADGSHVDSGRAAEFTRVLAQVLAANGIQAARF